MNLNHLRKIIKEVIETEHYKERFNQRINGKYSFETDQKAKELGFKQFTSIKTSEPESVRSQILYNLNFIKNLDFSTELDGIVIEVFKHNKNFVTHFYDDYIGRDYIFKGEMEDKAKKIWVVIRYNELRTIMISNAIPNNAKYEIDIDYLKSYVKSKEKQENEEEEWNGIIEIKDIKEIIKKQNKDKQVEKDKNKDEGKLIVNIKGVLHVVDKNEELVYKKNNDKLKYDAFDFVEDLNSTGNNQDKEKANEILEFLVESMVSEIIKEFITKH